MKTKFIFNFILLAALAASAAAQTTDTTSAPAKPKPIQDNSFLVEEAYNQEDGVVQHISTFQRDTDTNTWRYSFTQEWPVTGQKHQFSYTLETSRFPGVGTGFGDVALNYRLQLIGSGETKLAVSPRVSLLLPSGDSNLGFGTGGTGIQFNLPVSVQWNDHLVTHSNVGATFTPNAKNPLRHEASTRDVNLGQSFIWLAHQNFNVMFETAFASEEFPIAPGMRERENSLFLSPGVRWAHNFESGLQIVPGVAFPIGAGPSKGDKGVFFYISFEHPFGRKGTK